MRQLSVPSHSASTIRDATLMRVLHIFKTYPPDNFTGIPRVIHAIATGAAPLGVVSSVLTVSRRPPGTESLDGHNVHSARLDFDFGSTPISFSLPRRLRELAAGHDIVHYHFPWPMADLAHLLARHGKPCVLTYHSDVVRQRLLLPLYRPLMNRHLGAMDRIVATSPDYLASSPVLGALGRDVEVIPIGLDAPAGRSDPATAAYWRERCGERFFLFLGVLRYYKGLSFLLEAARLTGLPVVIAGSGPEEGRLARLAAEHAIANVRFVGQVSEADKAALFETATALVLPSHLRSEAYGVVLVEAAMAGTPMITTAIGTGTSFVNVDGETGLVVPPADPASLATAMRRLWDDPALVRRFGDAAIRRHSRLLTGAAMAKRYAALYRSLASG